jgi:hypothetical protein
VTAVAQICHFWATDLRGLRGSALRRKLAVCDHPIATRAGHAVGGGNGRPARLGDATARARTHAIADVRRETPTARFADSPIVGREWHRRAAATSGRGGNVLNSADEYVHCSGSRSPANVASSASWSGPRTASAADHRGRPLAGPLPTRVWPLGSLNSSPWNSTDCCTTQDLIDATATSPTKLPWLAARHDRNEPRCHWHRHIRARPLPVSHTHPAPTNPRSP